MTPELSARIRKSANSGRDAKVGRMRTVKSRECKNRSGSNRRCDGLEGGTEMIRLKRGDARATS
jgi:hypothetical protein